MIQLVCGKYLFNSLREAVQRCVLIQADIVNLVALSLQLFSEMAHGRKDEGQLFLMVFHIGGFSGHFAHKNNILLRIGAIQARDLL